MLRLKQCVSMPSIFGIFSVPKYEAGIYGSGRQWELSTEYNWMFCLLWLLIAIFMQFSYVDWWDATWWMEVLRQSHLGYVPLILSMGLHTEHQSNKMAGRLWSPGYPVNPSETEYQTSDSMKSMHCWGLWLKLQAITNFWYTPALWQF